MLILIVICLAGTFAIYYFSSKNKNEEKELAYTELINSINEDKIEKIEMTTGSNTVKVIMVGEGEEKDREKTAIVPSIQAFMEWVNDKIDNKEIQKKLSKYWSIKAIRA